MIGVVGGMGPYAGLDLVRKIFDETKAARDQDHLSVSLLSFPSRVPDRTEFLLGRGGNPADAIFEILRQLEATGAVVAGIPCNTSHAAPILDRVSARLRESGSRLRLLNMIEEVARHLRAEGRGLRRVAPLSTLGTYRLRLYFDVLGAAGFELVDPGEDVLARVHEAIYDAEWGIKARSSPVTARAREVVGAAIAACAAAGAEAVVLGCTELPLAFPEPRLGGVVLVDPTAVLARALIREVARPR